MNRDKNEVNKLPNGWILCESKSNPGRKYYFNKKTGKSSWTEPQVDPTTPSKESSKEKLLKEDKPKSEVNRKKLKRKNEGIPEEPAKKRKDLSPEKKLNVYSEKKPKNKKSSLKKITPSKNIAKTRLEQLRVSLTVDINNDDNSEESVKKSRQSCQKTNSSETQENINELKNLNANDSKCLTTIHSPSESLHLQSTSCPSQFFTANRIISSMKSHLPDEYVLKEKQNETYADIEKDIYSQTPEYPSTKHPATPPQFFEASKLVSAIKSKLSYNFKDELNSYKSAKDRMETLRTRLSNEVVADNVISTSFINDSLQSKLQPSQEEMEVEESKEVSQSVPIIRCPQPQLNTFRESVVLVVDTNIFIHELDFIKNAINSHIKGYREQPTLLVPWRVVNELDRLKDNNNGQGAICKRARAAMDYLYKSLPENNRIKGQSLRDANCHIYPCEVPDDEILNCCLQQQERAKTVILLSNDKNLCNKANINQVKCVSLNELKELLENKPQPVADPDLEDSVNLYKNAMYQLLSNILENEMRAKYNNLWQHVLFKAPPWTLADVLQCLLKHWIAVFNDVFPRIEHLITELKNALASIQNKDAKTLSKNEVTNFKELCMELAKKCQIIPEYMELAKLTVERLERKCNIVQESKQSEDCEKDVIAAFEAMWAVFSSFCAKISTGLGISHEIQDNMETSDTLEVLVSKLPVFSNRINVLTMAIKGILEEDSGLGISEYVMSLEAVFKENLALINYECSKINTDNLKIFCKKCRNMLQEAFSKFLRLTDLLDKCKNNIAIEMN